MNMQIKQGLMLAAVIVPIVGACSDSPTEPNRAEPMTREFYYGNEQLDVVDRSYAVEGAIAEAFIGKAGGSISAGGVMLVIPAGALDRSVEISLTVPAGDQLNIELQPHGLQFKKPAYISFALSGTSYDETNAETELSGAYHEDGITAHSVRPFEIMNVKMVDGMASFGVWHFSEYALTKKKKGIILVGG